MFSCGLRAETFLKRYLREFVRGSKLLWCARRWGIEVLHRTLKSGCRIEQRQRGQANRIEASLAIDLVVAWRLYCLSKLGREVAQAPCTVYFEEAE